MKTPAFLALVPILTGTLALSAYAQSAAVTNGSAIDSTPSTAVSAPDPGSVPVKKAVPTTPAAPAAANGVVHSSGAGLTDPSSRQPTGTTVTGAAPAPAPAKVVVPVPTGRGVGTTGQ